MDYSLDREDIVLLLLQANQAQSGSPEFKGITRLEKMIFLLANENGVSSAEEFKFEPYKFGPFSRDIYEAIDYLQGIDLVLVSEKPIPSYYATTEEEMLADSDSDEDSAAVTAYEKTFCLTEKGKIVADKLHAIWQQMYPTELSNIEANVQRYSSLPLSQLIRYVYHRFPRMAEKSIHPEALNI